MVTSKQDDDNGVRHRIKAGNNVLTGTTDRVRASYLSGEDGVVKWSIFRLFRAAVRDQERPRSAENPQSQPFDLRWPEIGPSSGIFRRCNEELRPAIKRIVTLRRLELCQDGAYGGPGEL